ncbi:MAG: MFS transporter [Candidatus Hydrogenedentes bacterium]|nr:MFS transporter [Candidatus Hydrogenedentota bacterium]
MSSELNKTHPHWSVRALRALRYRDFRLFFVGQTISLVGTWMQIIAMSWLVYRLTNSPFMLGLVGFCGQIPSMFVAPFAGVLADRWERRKILVATQTLSMIQALAIASLVLTGWISVWQLIPLSVFLGCINAFDIPARQSLFVEMVEDRNDLGNAIALNSSMVNGARLIGPSVAGILIAIVGEGVCFLINGISFLAVIGALLAMRPSPRRHVTEHPPVLASLKEGFTYAFGFSPVRSVLLLLALVSVVGVPYSVLMPIFAEKILHGGPHTLGFLMGTAGFGALAGAIYLASRPTVHGLGRILVMAVTLFGVGLVAFSFSTNVWVSMLLLLTTGFGMLIGLAGCNTILQTIVDDDKRGRIMSFYTMAFMGMTPWGNLLAGGLASRFGAPLTVRMGGIACILGALIFATRLPRIRELVRPIYASKNILPTPESDG